MNDLWVYRALSNRWTWIQGSSVGGSNSPSTYPSSRMPTAVRWLGSNTVLLFGGHRTGINSNTPDYSDSWQFRYTLSNLTLNCTVGRFFSGASTSACLPCPSGFSKSVSATNCSQCTAGRYNPNSGSSDCMECTAGFFSSTGKSTCDVCQTGRFSSGNAFGECSPCPLGMFSNVTQSSVCQNCSSGTFASSTGLTVCSPCQLGKVNELVGQSVCSSCHLGKYSDISGMMLCLDCPMGLYTSSLGNSVCSSCAFGTFMASIGASSCLNCAPGLFANTTGSSSCSPCSFGTYSNRPGLSQCSPCSVGTFGSYWGNSFCETCPYPKVTRSEGQSTCFDCGLGEAYSNPASCSKCSIGFYANQTGSTSCFACLESTTRRIGSVSTDDCSICNEGFYGQPPSPCKRCAQVTAITCPAGSIYPSIEAGFFRAGTDGDDVNVALSCFPSQACLRSGEVLNTPCANGYTGYLCGSCAQNFYRLDLNCRACPSDAVKWFTVILFVVVLLAVIGRVTIQKNQMPPDVRVTLQATQMISLFPSISNKWPKEVLVIMQIYSASVSLVIYPVWFMITHFCFF
jgi:hypothetical protein